MLVNKSQPRRILSARSTPDDAGEEKHEDMELSPLTPCQRVVASSGDSHHGNEYETPPLIRSDGWPQSGSPSKGNRILGRSGWRSFPNADDDTERTNICVCSPIISFLLLCAFGLFGAVMFFAGYTKGQRVQINILSGDQGLAGPAATSSRSTLKAFVCITGQLPRLELRNKVENLLRPLRYDFGAETDVALVISDSDHSSNKHTADREYQEYFTMEEILNELSLYGNLLNDELDVQSQDPLIPPKYLDVLGKKDVLTPEEERERVRNHLRQFETLSKCHLHMSKTGKRYDVVHRIRDDTGYYRSVNVSSILELFSNHSMSMVTSACATHGGINDRGAFVSHDAAYDYFNDPIIQMYTQPIPDDVDNTEKFLDIIYKKTIDNMVVDPTLFLFKFTLKNIKGSKRNQKGFYHKSDKKCIADNDLTIPP